MGESACQHKTMKNQQRERITLDKYEYKVRADEIKELIAQGDYAQAAEIADTIDWRRVKSVMMLCTISDLYKINRRYEDARDMLLLAYERRPGGRTICYSLCELSIKTEEFVQAVEYYKEFVQVAPKDPGRYILQYKLYEAQDVSIEERIQVLEELKKRDYREKWAYELAYLYHRVGLATRCVEECDEMILWFGEGKYVIKAMELKMLHEPLTPEQQEKYDNRFRPAEYEQVQTQEAAVLENNTENHVEDNAEQGLEGDAEQAVEETGEQNPDEIDIHVKTMDVGQYNTINLQAELAAGLREVLGEESAQDNIHNPITRSIVAPMMESDTESLDYPQIDEVCEEDLGPESEEMEGSEVFFGETGEIGDLSQNGYKMTGKMPAEEAAATEAVTEVVAAEDETNAPGARSVSDAAGLVTEEVTEAVTETVTGNVAGAVIAEETTKASGTKSVSEAAGLVTEKVAEGAVNTAAAGAAGILAENHIPQEVPDVTAEIVMEQMRMEKTGEEKQEPVSAEPPKELANVLSQESDGQISFVMPEKENIEKQITGQMSIEDIIAEWERMKKENEEKRKEEVRRHVLQQTDSMFTEFEAAVRDGLLEQLEKGEIDGAEAVEAAEAGTDTIVRNETADGDASVAATFVEDIPTEDTAVEEVTAEGDGIQEDEAEESVMEEAAGFDGEFSALSEETYAGESADIIEEESVGFPEEEPAGDSFGNEETAEEYAGENLEETEDIVWDVEEEYSEEYAETGEAVQEASAVNAEEVDTAAAEAETGEIEKAEETEEEKPAVERDKAKVRALTREERELYAPFVQSRSAREQLVQAIDNISMAAYTGNIIITGEEGMDTLTLAKNMIREVQMEDSNFSGKVAKISGSALNRKDVATVMGDLKNGALIILKASDMDLRTAAALHKSLQQEHMGIIVVLVDTRKAMNLFLAENKELHSCFTARMDMEALSDDTLVAFGRQYAREMEYSIDEMGVLALHTRIADMQTSDHIVTVVEVKQIVDDAIHHANRKTIGHFFDILLARRYDDEDMIILGEKDFV